MTKPSRALLLCLCGFAVLLCLRVLVVVVQRVAFPYDFITWPDDYVLNQLVKLHFGAALYGSYDDANSSIYAPGLMLLHHALLAPFALDLSVVANRILSQCWLALAVTLSVPLIVTISEGARQGRLTSIGMVAGASATLLLASYSDVVADSMHPATLELLGLAIAANVIARWPRFSSRARMLLALSVPAGCFLAKQTGVSAALAMAAVALMSEVGSLRQRLLCSGTCLLSVVLAFGALELATDGGFGRWGLLLPLRQPREWAHARFLTTSLAAITPLLVLVADGAQSAVSQRASAPHAAWLRVAVLPCAYLPMAMPAFFKTGGGAHDFGALAFLGALLMLAQLRNAWSTNQGGLRPALVATLVGFQLLLWAPYRRPPTQIDRAWSARVCAHVAEALECGEHVLIDLGTSCMVAGGIAELPRDRLLSLMELSWSGVSQAGTAGRLAHEDYDLLLLHSMPVPWPWPEAALDAIAKHYTIYQTIDGVVPARPKLDSVDKRRLEGWQDLEGTMFLFERKRDAGRHRTVISGRPRCQPAR